MVANYANNEHPHPSTIESDICPTESEKFSSCSLDEYGNLVVNLSDEQFLGAPELWYILEETSSPIDMVTIHAMIGGAFPNGTVVAVRDIRNFSINPHDRVGFIKWFREDSRMQQIYVSDDWRRKRISTTLIAVADIVVISGSYGKYLNGGDITTSDGEKLRETWKNSPRVIPRIGSVES